MNASVSDTYDPEHDPLCPFFYDHIGRELVRQTGNPCTYCDLIARVREDERTNEPPAWAYANGYTTALRVVGELVAWQLGKCNQLGECNDGSSTAVVLKKLIDWIDDEGSKL